MSMVPETETLADVLSYTDKELYLADTYCRSRRSMFQHNTWIVLSHLAEQEVHSDTDY